LPKDANAPTRPAPVIGAGQLPQHWTASTHQRLIDCPYRFFAADILQLSAREEIREALEKADYGEYVHRILQAFHGGVRELPGPWQGPLTNTERVSATSMLNDISQAVFKMAVEENLLARSWLKRWLAYIPDYIDWTIERQKQWQPHTTELRLQRETVNGVRFKGRVDRIDKADNQWAIIDYKTGMTPGVDTVIEGEAVQLPSYALLSETEVNRVEYVQFDKNKINDSVNLKGEELQQLVHATEQRLLTIQTAIDQGSPLPAWGDPGVCRYCEFDGVCRRDSWQDDAG